jgi:2-C-methyl-D-erythritol 2,4-cyclodiphosphate synthase
MLFQDGWRLGNLDLTIACEQPRIAPHAQAMRETMARVLQTPVDTVSVKATTTEKLGFCGRGEGIAALAVVLIKREK